MNILKNVYRSTDCGSLRLVDAGKTETLEIGRAHV